MYPSLSQGMLGTGSLLLRTQLRHKILYVVQKLRGYKFRLVAAIDGVNVLRTSAKTFLTSES